MKKVFFAVLVVALAFTCGTAFAAGNKIQAGSSEFAIFTGIDSSESSASGSQTKNIDETTSLDLRYGYFLTDGLQLGVSYMGQMSKSWSETNGTKDANSESESQVTFLYLDLKYNFVWDRAQVFVPYLGVGVGSASTKFTYQDIAGNTQTSTGSGTATAVMGGVKYFVTENASVNAELRVDSFTYTPSGSAVEYTTDTTGINFGLSVYF